MGNIIYDAFYRHLFGSKATIKHPLIQSTMSNFESHEKAMKWAAGCKCDAENAIREAIEEFERQTGLQVDGIDYDRPLRFAGGTSPIAVTVRAMLP